MFSAIFQDQPVEAWATTVGEFTGYHVHVGKHPNLVAGQGPDAMVVIEDVRLLSLASDWPPPSDCVEVVPVGVANEGDLIGDVGP